MTATLFTAEDPLLASELNEAFSTESGDNPWGGNPIIDDNSVFENQAGKVIRRKSDGNVTVPTTPSAATDAVSKSHLESTSITTFKNGVTTFDMSSVSGTTTVIAHGLGATPKRVQIKGMFLDTNGNQEISLGDYNGTSMACVNTIKVSNTEASTAYVIKLYDATGESQSGTIAIDATNITLTWTKVSTPTGTARIMWSAEA